MVRTTMPGVKGKSGVYIHNANQGFQKGKIGNNHPCWKGDNCANKTKHGWIINHFGHPQKCEDCGLSGEKINGRWNIDWSNVDHEYSRNPKDYSGRCKKCHEEYDRKYNDKYERNTTVS